MAISCAARARVAGCRARRSVRAAGRHDGPHSAQPTPGSANRARGSPARRSAVAAAPRTTSMQPAAAPIATSLMRSRDCATPASPTPSANSTGTSPRCKPPDPPTACCTGSESAGHERLQERPLPGPTRSRGTQAPRRRPTRRAGHPPAGQRSSSGHLQSRRRARPMLDRLPLRPR